MLPNNCDVFIGETFFFSKNKLVSPTNDEICITALFFKGLPVQEIYHHFLQIAEYKQSPHDISN